MNRRLVIGGARVSFVLVAIALAAAPHGSMAETVRETLQLHRYPVTIEYDPAHNRVARRVGEIIEEAAPRLMVELGVGNMEPFRVVLVSDIEEFSRQQGVSLPDWGIAFAFMNSQVMLVDVGRATAAWNALERVIPHELSHLLLAQRVGAVGLPVWFTEGLAVWQSQEWTLFENWRLMEAVWSRRAPPLGRIYTGLPHQESRVRDAYRVAYTGFVSLFGREANRLPAFLDEVKGTEDFSVAFEQFFDETEVAFYSRFDAELHRKYRSRLLLFQAGPLFSIVAVLFLFVYLRTAIRNRRELRRLERIDRGLAPDDRE